MAGKRVRKKETNHLPGVLLMLAALAALLLMGEPSGIAADSPAEAAEPEAVTQVEEPMAEERETAEETKPAWEGPVPVSERVEDTYFDDAVFLGDSRTDGLRIYGGMNHGTYLQFTGATVESVFTKEVETPVGTMPLLDALAQMECGKIFVMLGVNELGWKGTEIFRNQSALLIQRLQEDHPDAEIVIQSILPVSAEIDGEGRYVNNQRIIEYNQVWLELAEEFDVSYMNVAECVADAEGCLPKDLCYDGVHLNKAGCRLWLDYLRTHAVGDIQDVLALTAVETEETSEPVLPAAEHGD